MTNRADRGDPASGNRAGDRFFIEAPEILQRATATADNQDIGNAVVLCGFDGSYDVSGRRLALNGSGVERYGYSGAPPGENGEYVVDRGAGG